MKLLSIFVIILSFTQCASNKLVQKPPFKVQKASYHSWVGGQPGIRGIVLKIQLENIGSSTFDSLYFRERITKVKVSESEEMTQVIGHFSTSNIVKRDLILDSNPTKELNNTLPVIKKFPFQLSENEAIISYKKGNKTHYFKIENIQKEQPKIFTPAHKK